VIPARLTVAATTELAAAADDVYGAGVDVAPASGAGVGAGVTPAEGRHHCGRFEGLTILYPDDEPGGV